MSVLLSSLLVIDSHLSCRTLSCWSMCISSHRHWLAHTAVKRVAREELRDLMGWCLEQASSGSLRLYAGDNLRTADRTTLKKAALDGQFGFAGAFCSSRGPGIACISPDGILKVPQCHCLHTLLLILISETLLWCALI